LVSRVTGKVKSSEIHIDGKSVNQALKPVFSLTFKVAVGSQSGITCRLRSRDNIFKRRSKYTFGAEGYSEDNEKKDCWRQDQKRQVLAGKEKTEKSGQRKTR
jgi:hypothetical protein